MAEYTTATRTGGTKKKIKTQFAKIIVNNNPEKTYYNIMWWQDGEMHIGFGSTNLSFVRKWLNEEFDVEYPAADVAPVVHGRWVPFHSEFAGNIQYCSACEIGNAAKSDFCPRCGGKMDGGVEDATD